MSGGLTYLGLDRGGDLGDCGHGNALVVRI